MKLVSRFRRSLSFLVLFSVLGYSLVYALAWIQLYLQPHPYKVASEWIFENVPQGSMLAGPHWDDRLPLSIPGKDAPRYYQMETRDAELPFYERDTKEKLSLLAQRISKADYLVFPTARIADSIPRVPEEYPYTNALLQLLWAEKLGFTFEKAIKDRPSFLGITFNDDLADESFSVYDHPKVVVFKNRDRLTAEQIRERVLNVKRYEPLPSLNEMLLMDEGGWASTATIYNPNPKRLAKTFGLLIVLGLSTWVLFSQWLSFLPDRGLGASLLGGVVLSGGLTWGSAALGILPFNAVSGTFFVGLVILAAMIRLVSSGVARHLLKDGMLHHGANVLFALFAGVATVVITKSIYPNYFWSSGEFERFALEFFSRNETIPPQVGWNPIPDGSSLYGAHLLAGWLVKVVGATGTFAYELCFVMLGGAVGGVVYTVVSFFVRRPYQAIIITLIALVPVIRGTHAAFNGYSGLDIAEAQQALSPNHQRLVDWLSENVKGAPIVIESCDQPESPKIANRVGLPTLKGESAQSLCSLGDVEGAFKGMMSNNVELLIVPGADGDPSLARQELIAKFLFRPDFFAPIYTDGGTFVFAPAFSDYFPRAYTVKSDIE